MIVNLVLGPLVALVGLVSLAQQLIQIRREQQSSLPPAATPGERALSIVFLGMVPILAGAVFLAAGWIDEGQAPPAATVQAMYAPLN